MKLTFAEFSKLDHPVPVIINSLERALYQITVIIAGKGLMLVENSGETFRCRSLQQAREALQALPISSLTLRQESAYDEMVGQPMRQGDNLLEVPLSLGPTIADGPTGPLAKKLRFN